MTIAEVSKRVGLSPDTLRYYERVGLIPKVNRNESGVRDYTEEDCVWIEFIKCMRKAGLPVKVLIEYVSLYQQGPSTINTRKQILVKQRQQLINNIRDMQETLDYLDRKIERYEETIMRAEDKLVAVQR